MHLMRILGRSLVDSFCDYVWPLIEEGGDYQSAGGEASGTARSVFRKALAAGRSADLPSAREWLERALEKWPGMAGGRLALAAVLSDLGHVGKARALLDGLAQERRADGRLWFLSGQLAERCGEIERAVECYKQAMGGKGAGACEGAERLAAIYVATEDYEQARQTLVWLVEAMPESFEVRVELAAVLSLLDWHADAIRTYQDSLLLEPDAWEARQDLAGELERAGRLGEALLELRRVLAEHGTFADLHLRAAKLSWRLGDVAGARRHVESALETNPRYLEALVFRGMILTEQGKHQAAVSSFRQAIEVNEEYLTAYAGLATALERRGQHSEAEETLELARRIAPGSEAIYARLTEVRDLGRRECREVQGVAEVAVRSSRRAGPEGDVAFCPHGAVERAAPKRPGRRDYDETMVRQLERHRQAVRRHPRFADLRYNYGLLLASVGRAEEAREQYRATAEINPRYVPALVRLALGSWRAGRPDEARHALEKAHAASAADVTGHYRFGLIRADRGRWGMTLEALASRLPNVGGEESEGAIKSAEANLGLASKGSRVPTGTDGMLRRGVRKPPRKLRANPRE